MTSRNGDGASQASREEKQIGQRETQWNCMKSGVFSSLFDQGYWLQVPREFLKIIGDGNAAFFLAYLTDGYRFYSNYMNSHEGWFYRTSEATEQVLGLSYKQQIRAIEKLLRLGFIEVCRKGKDGLRHFRINEKAVFAAVMDERNSDLPNPDMPKWADPNRPDMPKWADPDMPKWADRVRTRRKIEREEKKQQTTSCPPDGSAVGEPIDVLSTNPSTEEVEQVWTEYKKYHSRSILDKKRRKLITTRLKEGFTAAMLIAAIEGNHRDPHCNGQNDRQTEYHAIELILRDAGHIEHYAAQAAQRNGKQRGGSLSWWSTSYAKLNGFQQQDYRARLDVLRSEIIGQYESQVGCEAQASPEKLDAFARTLGYPGYAAYHFPCSPSYRE